MTYQRLVFVLPCYGMDDFPETLPESDAVDFLGAWTSLWHPGLLLATNSLPEWKRADSNSLDIQDAIIVCPKVAAAKVDAPLRERLALGNCLFIESDGNRSSTLKKIHSACLEAIPCQPQAGASQGEQGLASEVGPASEVECHQDFSSLENLETQLGPEDQARLLDFFAFGYAYLQIHLLTRKLRYSSTLDQPLLTEQAVEASKALLKRDSVECEKWLQSCFDQLAQERDHYYSQSAHLIDVTLLAPTTLGAKLAKQLQEPRSQNILASARILKELMEKQPETFHHLQASTSEGRACIVGGLEEESPLPLLTPVALRRTLDHGRTAYQKLSFPPPQVFARFESGIGPDMSMALKQAGYQGMLLLDWTGSSYPTGNQAKITWEGADGTGLDAIANFVIDAGSAASFLAIGAKLGAQLDHHQVPTVLLAHWPGACSDAMQDLIRCTNRSPALGIWSKLDDYFSTTQRPYHSERLAPNRFANTASAFPSDSQRVVRDYWKASIGWGSAASMSVLVDQIAAWMSGRKKKDASSGTTIEGQASPLEPSLKVVSRPELDSLGHSIDVEFPKQIERGSRHAVGAEQDAFVRSIEESVASLKKEAAAKLLQALPRENANKAASPSWVVVNPYAGPRRVFLRSIPGRVVENPDQRVYAAHENPDGTSSAVVDVPPLGIVRIQSSPASKEKKWTKPISGADGILGNEFVEAHFDREAGRLSALYIARKRGNRLSGMLAIRHAKQEQDKLHRYTTMKVERSSIVENTSTCARLNFEGSFPKIEGLRVSIEYTLWRGSRALEVEVRMLSPARQLLAPGDRLVWRTAWPSESAVVSYWNQGVKQTWTGRRAFAPLAIEVDEAEHRCLIATGGISNHERFDSRFLDSWIPLPSAPSQEASLLARIALAIDAPRPYQFAMEWLDPAVLLEDERSGFQVGCGAWFVHCSAPNLGIHCYASLADAQGSIAGMRIFIHETEGKSTPVKIECFRAPRSAERVDSSGRSLGKIEIVGDSLSMSVRPHEQSFIDIQWS